jgi:hypothetical protein
VLTWRQVTAETWVLADSESERPLRQVAVLGPYLGEADPQYRVTGPGYDYTDHASLSEAMTAAERSLGQT